MKKRRKEEEKKSHLQSLRAHFLGKLHLLLCPIRDRNKFRLLLRVKLLDTLQFDRTLQVKTFEK